MQLVEKRLHPVSADSPHLSFPLQAAKHKFVLRRGDPPNRALSASPRPGSWRVPRMDSNPGIYEARMPNCDTSMTRLHYTRGRIAPRRATLAAHNELRGGCSIPMKRAHVLSACAGHTTSAYTCCQTRRIPPVVLSPAKVSTRGRHRATHSVGARTAACECSLSSPALSLLMPSMGPSSIPAHMQQRMSAGSSQMCSCVATRQQSGCV